MPTRRPTARRPPSGRAPQPPRVTFSELSTAFRALGHVENLRLLVLLRPGPSSVAALASAAGVSARLAAQRLSRLASAGLVVAHAAAAYALRDARARNFVEWAVGCGRAPVRSAPGRAGNGSKS